MGKLFIINGYDYIVQPYNPEDPNDFLNVNEVFYYMNGHFGEDTVYAENERIIQNIID